MAGVLNRVAKNQKKQKSSKKSKAGADGGAAGSKRELLYKEDSQEYAQVLRALGDGRFEVACVDGVRRLCHVRGKMRRRVYVRANDVVLIALREFQNDKADLIHKYEADEVRRLHALGELSAAMQLDGMLGDVRDDDGHFLPVMEEDVEFVDDDDL